MPLDKAIKSKLMDNGVDELLANHFAHLFIRDPIVIFEETLHQDDETSSDHFEASPPLCTQMGDPIS
jgi:glutamate--cysteine ligase catalytic subunit